MDKKTFRDYRLAKGFTQREVAIACDITEATYNNIENYRAKNITDVMTYKKICKKLDVSMDDIFLPNDTNLSCKVKVGIAPKPKHKHS